MRRNCINLLVAAFWGIVGCSGGGGSSLDHPLIFPQPEDQFDPTVFDGTYRISYDLTLNTCEGASLLSSLEESYVVSSGNDTQGTPVNNIVDNNGHAYISYATSSNTDGQTYFNASDSIHELPNFIPGTICTEGIALNFELSVEEGVKFANVSRGSDIICSDPLTGVTKFVCVVNYEGSGVVKKNS